MHIFRQKQHSLEDIYEWQRKLDNTIQKIQSATTSSRTGTALRRTAMQPVIFPASQLRMAVASALRSYREKGIVLQHHVLSIDYCLRSLNDAVGLSTRYRSTRTPTIQPKSLRSFLKIIGKMQEVLVRLSKDGVWESTVREGMIRDALRKLDKRLANADVLSSKEIKKWTSLIPGLEVEAPEQIARLANTIWLSRIRGQTWEVRYRSMAPGHPMQLVTASLGFPDRDLLWECYQYSGRPKELYVAAALPSWRVVCKISMEDFVL